MPLEEVIQEKFCDEMMSATNFTLDIEKLSSQGWYRSLCRRNTRPSDYEWQFFVAQEIVM